MLIPDFPDLAEIMSYGVGLSAALAIWSNMMNTPGMTPDKARVELERLRDPERCLLPDFLPPSSSVH